jgi:hypothetical protein
MAASQIGAALKARLAALVFSPAIPIAWGNVNYTPNGGRFLRAQIARVPNQRLTIAKGNRQAGSLVVAVASVAGNGTGEGEGIADAIEAWFPVDLILPMASGRLRITTTPSIRDGYEDAGYWRTPVVIPFEVLTA